MRQSLHRYQIVEVNPDGEDHSLPEAVVSVTGNGKEAVRAFVEDNPDYAGRTLYAVYIAA